MFSYDAMTNMFVIVYIQVEKSKQNEPKITKDTNISQFTK